MRANRVASVALGAILAIAGQVGAQAEATVSDAVRDKHGFLVHSVESDLQRVPTAIRVLLPESFDDTKKYAVLYVLPVEAGDEDRYGNGLREVVKHDLHNKYDVICVAPTFADLPWYADHPTDRAIQQESYFTTVVVPFIEATYAADAQPAGRLLVGFSKSGWGAFTMLVRHPQMFGRAAAWDAPLMMDVPGRYGSGPIFGTKENFNRYHLSRLLRLHAERVSDANRMIHLGYGNFRDHHEEFEALLTKLDVPHVYRGEPRRAHKWESGWLPEAVALLLSE